MNRDLILVAISLFTWGLGEGLFLSFQPIYLQQMGAEPILIGSIFSGLGLSMTISHIPAGYLADKLGRKPVMLVAWTFGTIATLAMALANSLPFFVFGLILYGVTVFVSSPLNSYVTAARGKLSVGRAMTLVSACFNLGTVLGPWLGGQIGSWIGLRYAYFFSVILFVVSSFIILAINTQPIEMLLPDKNNKTRLINPHSIAFLSTLFLAIFAMYLTQPLSPNYLQDARSLNLQQIGLLYSINSIGVVVLNLLLGHFPAQIGFILAQIAVGVFTILVWKSPSMLGYTIGFFCLGGYRTARALGMAQVRKLFHQANMGLGYGLTETIGGIALILAPLLAGFLYTNNPTSMYWVSGSMILISVILSIRFSPREP